jgi:hypothetical protein
MSEAATALTDYALAAECALLAALARRIGTRLVLFFGAAGAAALLGGITHGALAPGGAARLLVWRATLLAIGVGASAAWAIGAQLALHEAAARSVARFAVGQLIAYAAAVLLWPQPPFALAVIAYLPAALFLLGVLLRIGAQLAALGVGLVLGASALQQLRIGVHPEHFDHNALYHVLQGMALLLLFLGTRRLLGAGRATDAADHPAC